MLFPPDVYCHLVKKKQRVFVNLGKKMDINQPQSINGEPEALQDVDSTEL